MASKLKKVKKKKTTLRLSPEQRALKNKQKALHQTIMGVFKSMGFEYMRTAGKEKVFGGQKGEIDCAFLYKNILLLVEETVSTGDRDHLRTKHFFYEKVQENFETVLDWLKKDYIDKFNKFDPFKPSQYKHFYVYISSGTVDKDMRSQYHWLWKPNYYDQYP